MKYKTRKWEIQKWNSENEIAKAVFNSNYNNQFQENEQKYMDAVIGGNSLPFNKTKK